MVNKKNPQLYYFGKPVTQKEIKANIEAAKWFEKEFPKVNKKPIGKTRIALAKILCEITKCSYLPGDIRQLSNQWSGSYHKGKDDFRMGLYDPCSWIAMPDKKDKRGGWIGCPHTMKDVIRYWRDGGVIEYKDNELSILDSFDIETIEKYRRFSLYQKIGNIIYHHFTNSSGTHIIDKREL